MENIMADIETLDNKPTSLILSIGAVEFDHTGVGERFYTVLNIQSCKDHGLTTSADTIAWWRKQSVEAKMVLKEANEGGQSLPDGLKSFAGFISKCGADKVWGNGATFDNVILTNAYEAARLQRPWKFWNDRCFRTLKNLYLNVPAPQKNDLAHNALSDALFQAEHAAAILAHIKGG